MTRKVLSENSISYLEILCNYIIANIEELELLGEDIGGDSRRPAKSAAALVIVKDRIETWTVAVEEVFVALAVVETGAEQRQCNLTKHTDNR